jgi:hypothetical protein
MTFFAGNVTPNRMPISTQNRTCRRSLKQEVDLNVLTDHDCLAFGLSSSVDPSLEQLCAANKRSLPTMATIARKLDHQGSRFTYRSLTRSGGARNGWETWRDSKQCLTFGFHILCVPHPVTFQRTPRISRQEVWDRREAWCRVLPRIAKWVDIFLISFKFVTWRKVPQT